MEQMNLEQVTQRLAELDVEVREAQDVEKVEKAAEEKKALLERKAELSDLEERKQVALKITAGEIKPKVIEERKVEKMENPEIRADVDKYSTVEYRKAFMEYCKTGNTQGLEMRIDAFANVAEVAAMVPTTIMNEVIKEMKVHGQLYNRVRKTNVAGGVQVPIATLLPIASRITEATPSDRKKMTLNTYVTFSYIGLECKIAVSLLANTVTLPAFESMIIPLITEAMIKQMEIEIIKGVGTTEMLGVAVDTRVLAGQSITLSAAEFKDWGAWKKKVFAKIPLAYRSGIFVMAAGTFEGYIDGMQDANGQPMARVNYGIADGPQERFGGKEVLLVEEDVVSSYDTAAVTDVVAVYMNPSDYVINSNMQMAMYRYLDHDLNQWVDKAILINDGKLLDAAGVLLIKKGA